MGLPEIDALLHATLSDPRMPPDTRAAIERVVASPTLTPDAMMAFCAHAFAYARVAAVDPRFHQTMVWLRDLARMALPPEAPATPPRPEAPAAKPAARRGLAEVHFSPGDACLRAIRGQFAAAKKTADVCVFTITDDRIADAMLEAHRRGVKLRVVTDNDKAEDEGSDVVRLARAGVALRVDRTEHHMHHKFAVFDGARVLTGSYNWTRSAANYNAENLLVSDDERLVASYDRAFESLWSSLG